MANRRMFSLKIIDTDLFLDMPITARLLYYDLSMRARDKGIIKNAKSICRKINVDVDNLSILVGNKYIKHIDKCTIQIVHWDENNGIAETAHKRLSYRYRKWRESVLRRDNYKCTECNSTKNLNVHHKKNFSEFEELRYDINNGITLCESCHKKLHKRLRRTKNG